MDNESSTEQWQKRVVEACRASRVARLSNGDAMAIALQLAAFGTADWPDSKFALPSVATSLDADDRPDLEYCEQLLALADTPVFDAVAAMFDVMRCVDRAYLKDAE